MPQRAPQNQPVRHPQRPSQNETIRPTSIELEQEKRRVRLRAQLDNIHRDFRGFCRTTAGYFPPDILPSEALRAFEQFAHSRRPTLGARDHPLSDAFSQFEAYFNEFRERVSAKLRRISSAIFWAKFTLSAKARQLLSGVSISIDVPDLTPDQLRSLDRNTKYISTQNTENAHVTVPHGSISIIKNESRVQSYIQLCTPDFGCVYLTVPSSLNPTEVAHEAMRALARPISASLGDADPVLALNGDVQELNIKAVLADRVVLKASSNSPDGLSDLSERVRLIYNRAPLTADNTTILSGLPASPQDLPAVFREDETLDLTDEANIASMWMVWQDVAPAWAQSSERASFRVNTARTAQSFLSALQTEENVIVLVAHAKKDKIYFPDPLPDGSPVHPEDILKLRAEIAKNRPSVYLFCCEAAKFDESINSIKDALLEAGALFVVAPQIKIRAERTRKLFAYFLKYSKRRLPITALQKAERASKNRDLEVWIG